MADAQRSLDHYVIRGGKAGKQRLDLLARIMEPHTKALLAKVGVGPGARFLDLGCGAGHVSLEAARLVGGDGTVTGIDLDQAKLELARKSAAQLDLNNLRFLYGHAIEVARAASHDFCYARFLLTHLSDPLAVLNAMRDALTPGGIVVVEDINMTGSLCYPQNPHFRRAIELYSSVVRRRGGDPDIGYKLPGLLRQAGFEAIQVNVVQPLYLDGEHKKLVLTTTELIREPVLAEGLAGRDELDRTIEGLAAFTADPTTLISLPRVFQSWGARPQ